MKKFNLLAVLILLFCAFTFTSCDDDDSSDDTIEFPETTGTIAELKKLATGENGIGVQITKKIAFAGTVVSKPESLNLPKTLYIQTNDNAIKLSVDETSTTFKSLKTGQKVYLNTQGLFIGIYRNVPVLGNGTNEEFKVGVITDEKLKEILTLDPNTIKDVTPKTVTIPELSKMLDKVGTLVKIENVEFTQNDLGEPFYSGKGAYTDRIIVDAEGNKIPLSTYNKAIFGSEVTTDKSGTITALLSIYGGKPQLSIRSIKDINFTSKRFEEAKDPEPTKNEKVFFSEYGEGKGFNKYIEIYNGTGADINLANYSVRPAMNEDDWSDAVALSGTLKAGDVFVIYHADADAKIKAAGDYENSSLVNFNGDDAIGLFKKVGKGWSLCDVIGVPGAAKKLTINNITSASEDHTLIRKSTVTVGNPSWESAVNEWEVMPKDYWNSIGKLGKGDDNQNGFKIITLDQMKNAFDNASLNKKVDAEGWFTESVKGGIFWKTKKNESGIFIEATGFSTGQEEIETWVVTPGLNVDNTTRKNFTFFNQRGYSKGEKLSILISSDFDANKGISKANWKEIEIYPKASYNGYGDWLKTKEIDLSTYTGIVHIAFKYVGNGSSASGTWRVCNPKFNCDPNDKSGDPKAIDYSVPAFTNWGVENWENENKPKGFTKAENVTKSANIKHGGDFAIQFQSSSKTKDVMFKVPVKAGETYQISYWYLDNDNKAKTHLWSQFTDGKTKIKDSVSEKLLHEDKKNDSQDNAEWQQKVIEVVAPAKAKVFEFEVRVYKESEYGGYIYLDDFKVIKK